MFTRAVEKYPESCQRCRYYCRHSWMNGYQMCAAFLNSFGGKMFRGFNTNNGRPSWCPLVLRKEEKTDE